MREAAVAGLIVPSIDRVGRYFPLTLVWPIPFELSTAEVAIRFRAAFEHAERLLLDTLASEQIDFAQFDQRVMALGEYLAAPDPREGLRLTRAAARAVGLEAARPCCIPLRHVSALEAPALQIFGGLLDASSGTTGLWWTDGSAAVEPSWLITRGLPAPECYGAMLDGAGRTRGGMSR